MVAKNKATLQLLACQSNINVCLLVILNTEIVDAKHWQEQWIKCCIFNN